MSLTALVGDGTTTTTLAVAAGFPTETEVIVLEADRTGGSIAAWLDTPASPSLSAIVAGLRGTDPETAAAWPQIEAMIRRSRSGVRFIPAPVRSVEAAQSIDEAERTVFPPLARAATVLADVGRRSASDGVSTAIRLADSVVLCHRQATQSAAAAGVRLERAAELATAVSTGSKRVIVALIGDEPFDRSEVHDYLSAAVDPATLQTHVLADDPLAAAVLAGRTGVSLKRFSRLPLIRSARGLAELIAEPGPAEP